MVKKQVKVDKPESCAVCPFSHKDSDWGWSCRGMFFDDQLYSELLEQGKEVDEITPELIERNGGTSIDCLFISGATNA